MKIPNKNRPKPRFFPDFGRFLRTVNRRLCGLQVFGGGYEQSLVDVDILCGAGDRAGLAALARLGLAEGEVALDNLLLQDIEHTPQGVVAVLVADGLEDILDVLIVHVQVFPVETLADCDSLGRESGLLFEGEGGGPHIVDNGDLRASQFNALSHDFLQFPEIVVDVTDGEGGELGVGEDKAVGAHETEEARHELETVEAVVGVGHDDSGESLDFAVVVGDKDVRVLESEGVETPHSAPLVRALLFAVGDSPAEFGHVVDEGFGVGEGVLVRGAGIRLGFGENERGLLADFVLRHEGAELLALEGKHNVVHHILFF